MLDRRTFLLTASAASAAGRSARAQTSRLSSLDRKMSIEQRIRLIETFVHEHYYDDKGLLYSHINFAEERPLRESDFLPQTASPTGVSMWDWYNYENSPMVSGIFLASQVYRYQATKEPQALEYAARAFRSIDVNFRLSEGQAGKTGPLMQRPGSIDPNDRFEGRIGWISKPYGQMMTTQTSTEQNFGPMWGLYVYRPFASADTQERIDYIITSVARLWREMRYSINFFGEAWSFEQSSPRAQRHMPVWAWINGLAFELSGRDEFKREFERLHALYGAMPTARETNYGLGRRKYISTEDRTFHDKEVVVGDFLIDLHPVAADQYLRAMEAWWEFSGIGMRPDFFTYYYIELDTVTGAWKPLAKSIKPRPLWNGQWMMHNATFPIAWGELAGRRALSSVMVARRSDRLRQPALDFARRLYAALDKSSLRYMIDPERALEPEVAYLTNLLSGDCLAYYPAGYWYGRMHGMWT